MTTNHHDPIVFRSPANAETFNEPMAQLDEELTAQGSAIGTLQGQMSTANSNIGTLQSEMDTAQGDISTLQSQVAAAKAPIALCGRLTLASGNPEPGPVSDADTIYFTPYKGNQSVLWDSPALKTVQFAELALSLDYGPGIEQNSIYDVYLVDDAGTLRIGFGPAWASNTSRGTGAASAEITLKDGIWVNANEMYLTCGLTHVDVTVNAFEATLLGSFLAVDGGMGSPTGDGKTSDDATLGYLYNVYNQVKRLNKVLTVDADHEYSAATERNWNDSLETQLSVLLGLPGFVGQEMINEASNYFSIRSVVNDDLASSIWSAGLTIPYGQANKTTVFGECEGILGKNVAIVKEKGPGSGDGYFIDVRHKIFTMR